MLRRNMIRGSSLLAVVLATGCSSDDAKTSSNEARGSGGAAGESDAGAEGGKGGAATAPDPFTGDCKTAKWAHLSDECWTCMCGACEATLNLCKEGCTGVFECTLSEGALVNVAADLGCEVRAVVALCLKDPAAQAEARPLLTLDTCLIGAKKEAGEFRVCDTVCKPPYPGDVCERYPAPPAM